MAATICPRPWPWLLTLKLVWESHVTWGTPMQSFVFLGLLVFELEPMYATSDRQTTDADLCLMPPGGGIIMDANMQLTINRLRPLFQDTSLTFSKIPGISLTAVKFPDISSFSRQVVTLCFDSTQILCAMSAYCTAYISYLCTLPSLKSSYVFPTFNDFCNVG